MGLKITTRLGPRNFKPEPDAADTPAWIVHPTHRPPPRAARIVFLMRYAHSGVRSAPLHEAGSQTYSSPHVNSDDSQQKTHYLQLARNVFYEQEKKEARSPTRVICIFFHPEPAGPVGFVGRPDPLRILHVIKLTLPPSPQSPCIILTLLPANQLYYTVPLTLSLGLPVSQPASLAAPLLPAAAVFTFKVLLLEHCCHRWRGGYSSPSSKHVCALSTSCSIYSEILHSLRTQLLRTPFLSLWSLHVANTVKLAGVIGDSAGKGWGRFHTMSWLVQSTVYVEDGPMGRPL